MDFCRPFHGLGLFSADDPSTKVLGYFQIVRFADASMRNPFMNDAH